jgi:hypothetical protein
MLQPDLWERKLHLKWTDNMCIACVEARIGRKLKVRDFLTFPSVEGFPRSDILDDRIVGDCVVLRSGEMVARNSPRGRAELRKRGKVKRSGAGDASRRSG